MEAGPGFFTLGVLLWVLAGVSWPVSPAVSLGGSVGLDVLARFPLEFFNTDSASINGRLPALGWFFGMGRFLYPETRLFMRWHATEQVDLLVNVRAFYPLFHLWDGLAQPFIDQFMLSVGLGFSIRLGPAAGGTTPAAGDTPPAATS
jgi:hypothetical protein